MAQFKPTTLPAHAGLFTSMRPYVHSSCVKQAFTVVHLDVLDGRDDGIAR